MKSEMWAGESRGPSQVLQDFLWSWEGGSSVLVWSTGKGDVYANGDIDRARFQKVSVYLGMKIRAEMSRAQPSL